MMTSATDVQESLDLLCVFAYIGIIIIGNIWIIVTITNSKIKLNKSQKDLDGILNRYNKEDVLKIFQNEEGERAKNIKSIIMSIEYEDNSIDDILKEPIEVKTNRIPLSAMAKAILDVKNKIYKDYNNGS